MISRPVVLALWSLAVHALPPGFVVLHLESERPNEGLDRAFRLWPFAAMVAYAFAAAFLAFCVARRWGADAPERAIGAMIAMDLLCFALTWCLGQLYPSGVAIVPALVAAISVALLVQRRVA